MKIKVEKNVVEFTPASDSEDNELLALWRCLVDCAKFNKKITPIGEYLQGQGKPARFVIED